MFNFSPKWNFPSNNHSQTIGIADSGVETFKGTPIKSLAREICQNSLDARLDNSQPARIEFETFEIDPKTIPDAGNLKDVFNRCLEFWKVQDSNQARKFFNQAIKDMNRTSIKCLRISDFNTSGLTGSHEEYNSPWCNLTKSSGTSNKSGGRGGSFGIGKFAPFACSSLRTVFYSTYDINKTSASQGVSRLTTFKNKKGDTTQGIGFYGNDKNTPMYNQYSLNPKYSRPDNSTGTDIFIAGFTGEKNWEHQMVASILDGFLYAIYTGALVVDVDGIAISKDTLPELMTSHKEYFKEHADEYYRVLTDDEKARSFSLELSDDPETSGTLTLRLMIEPTFNRRVAMIRQTGMKIKDKGNINGIVPFAGTLLIEGDVDLLLTADRPSAGCRMNDNLFNQFVQHIIGQNFTVFIFSNQFDKAFQVNLRCFNVVQLFLQLGNASFTNNLFLIILRYQPLILSFRDFPQNAVFIQAPNQSVQLVYSFLN